MALADVVASEAGENAALAAKADAANALDAVATVAKAAQVVYVVLKYSYYPLSISPKLKTKTSSWHFFFVKYNRQLHTNLFFAVTVSYSLRDL
ncbi:MAG: hypothetical protein J7623_14675 [Chitinophaga sp.]|uniref:hypothetical protein n=1 Tax=Chitinophaga sp. TaxID=1869181 RepID=UPI001B2C31A1|nr:hypothetical protein [Chitinophaga sp.]MBO9729879.1 hypothetical protein [Chitinophaga sp.]